MATGEITTLLQDYDEDAWSAGFSEDGDRAAVWSVRGDSQIVFDLRGNALDSGPAPERPAACEAQAPVIVNGREHPSLQCIDFEGLPLYVSAGEPVQCIVPFGVSPDGRWHVYQAPSGEATQTPHSGPQLRALGSGPGDRRTLAAPRAALAIWRMDGPSGSAWSASGRYYVHIERGPRKRATLIDFTSRTVSDLTWSSEFGPAIEWSPVADILFRNAGPDAIAITNLETGVEHIIPGLQPPGAFDATGRFVYATSGSGRDQGLSVVEVRTGEVVQTFGGVPHRLGANLFGYPRPVVATDQGLVAVTRGNDEACEGTIVHRNDVQLACIEGGEYPNPSFDGSKIVLIRATAGPSPANPGREPEYEVVLYDIATDIETVLAQGARGQDAPITRWNVGSTHVLVEWPAYRGL